MEQSVLKLQRLSYILLLVCLIAVIMIFGRPFLIPLAWALMITFASVGFLDRMKNKLRIRWMPLVLFYVILILGSISTILFFLVSEVNGIITDVPQLDDRIQSLEDNFMVWLGKYGLQFDLDLHFMTSVLRDNTDTIFSIAGGVGIEVGRIFLILIYTFLLLYYKDVVLRIVHLKSTDEVKEKEAREFLRNVIGIISSYLSGTLITTALLAVLFYLLFIAVGLQYALFFAVFVAVLNLIPYIGNPIGMVVVVFFSFLTKEGLLVPVVLLIGINVANQIQENVFRPLVIGDRLHLNAFAVFVSVILGSFIWGVSGMILFTPVAGILKIILENNPNSRPYALLFGEIDQPQKEPGRRWFKRKRKLDAETVSGN